MSWDGLAASEDKLATALYRSQGIKLNSTSVLADNEEPPIHTTRTQQNWQPRFSAAAKTTKRRTPTKKQPVLALLTPVARPPR